MNVILLFENGLYFDEWFWSEGSDDGYFLKDLVFGLDGGGLMDFTDERLDRGVLDGVLGLEVCKGIVIGHGEDDFLFHE